MHTEYDPTLTVPELKERARRALIAAGEEFERAEDRGYLPDQWLASRKALEASAAFLYWQAVQDRSEDVGRLRQEWRFASAERRRMAERVAMGRRAI